MMYKNMGDINFEEEAEDLSPLHMAVEADDLDNFLDLLGRGFGTIASRNAAGLSPLHLAVRLRRRRIVDYLLPTFVTENCTDAWGFNHLHAAAMTEVIFEDNLVRNYIRQGILVDQKVIADSKFQPAASFVRASRLAQIKSSWPLKLNSYWESNHKGIQYWPGYAALHFAVENCNYRAVDELLLYGANPNIANDALITPLHMACALEPTVGLQFVQRLIDAGAKPDAVSRHGQTPVHVASYYSNDEAIAVMEKKRRFQQSSNNLMANSWAMADNELFMTSSNNNDRVAGGKGVMPGGSLIVANDLNKQHISSLEGGMAQRAQPPAPSPVQPQSSEPSDTQPEPQQATQAQVPGSVQEPSIPSGGPGPAGVANSGGAITPQKISDDADMTASQVSSAVDCASGPVGSGDLLATGAEVDAEEGGMAQQAQPPAPSPVQPESGGPSDTQPEPQQATQAQVPEGVEEPGAQPVITDVDECKLIEHELLMFLHAEYCQRHENQTYVEQWLCKRSIHCKTMKNLQKHMVMCKTAKNCPELHCSSIRTIIDHWNNCTRDDCSVCQPLRQAKKNHHSRSARAQVEDIANAMVAAAASQPTSHEPSASPSAFIRAFVALSIAVPPTTQTGADLLSGDGVGRGSQIALQQTRPEATGQSGSLMNDITTLSNLQQMQGLSVEMSDLRNRSIQLYRRIRGRFHIPRSSS